MPPTDNAQDNATGGGAVEGHGVREHTLAGLAGTPESGSLLGLHHTLGDVGDPLLQRRYQRPATGAFEPVRKPAGVIRNSLSPRSGPSW